MVTSQILAAKQQQPPLSPFDKVDLFDADTAALERQIDQMVYKLYNLTPEEVAIVEGIGVIMEIKHGRLRINNWKLLKPCRV